MRLEPNMRAAKSELAARRAQNRRATRTAFSFYATKNMTTGEGGMVTTPNETLAARMRMLSLHGMNRDAWNRYSERGNWYYEVAEPGFKYNLTDIQSALGIHQLRKLESFIETRARYAGIYRQELGDLVEVELPSEKPGTRHAWHLYILRLNLDQLNIDRQGFITSLRNKGVGTSVHFIPIPLHPYFRQTAHRRTPLRLCAGALSADRLASALPGYDGGASLLRGPMCEGNRGPAQSQYASLSHGSQLIRCGLAALQVDGPDDLVTQQTFGLFNSALQVADGFHSG